MGLQFARIAKIGASASLIALLLAGCIDSDINSSEFSGKSDSAPRSDVSIAMTTASENAAGFDPIQGWGCGEHVHEPLIQSTLITTDADMNFVNDLATHYAMSDDGMTWTFTLRDDVKFSDGTPLTAQDAAFTINKVLNTENAVCSLEGVKRAEATDPTQLVIDMEKPNNALLYSLAVLGIVPEASYSAEYGSKPIGSGRYMLEEWRLGEQVIFVANPRYYGEQPKIQRFTVAFMDEDPALAATRSGEIDVAYVYATKANQDIPGYRLESYGSVDSRGISLPTGAAGGSFELGGTVYEAGNAVTSDLNLRQAINYAIDRDALVEHVLKGYGKPAFSVSDGMPWASEEVKVSTDIDKARALLNEAGWKAGKDGILVKNGQRAEFELLYSAQDSTRQALAAEFANQMKAVGIDVSPRGTSWDEIYTLQYTTPVLWGWGSNSPSELFNLLHSRGWGNYALYFSSHVDAHLDAAISAPDAVSANQEYQAAQAGEDGVGPKGAATWVWLANVDHLYYVENGLHIAEQKPHPHGHGWSLVNNVDQWEW